MKAGHRYRLMVVDEHPRHYWLAEDKKIGRERARLLKNEGIEKYQKGDMLDAFLYTDKNGFLLATTTIPGVNMNEVKILKVKKVITAGAFLEWGINDDLFWPKSEQRHPLKEGKSYPIALYTDEAGQLLATGNIYPYLKADSPYKVEDEVTGVVYDQSGNWGIFVAVDNKYYGLIPKSELFEDLKYGDRVHARVMRIREDGKLDLAMRRRAHIQMRDDAEYLIDELIARDGFLPLNDKSSPDEIREQLRMSKAAFKRAIGRLLKKGSIKLSQRGIRLIKQDTEE